MEELTQASAERFLDRYEHFGGAFIRNVMVDLQQRKVTIELDGYDTLGGASNLHHNWRNVTLVVGHPSEFCFRERQNQSVVQAGLCRLVWLDNCVYVLFDGYEILDPLVPGVSLEVVRKSGFYVGGRCVHYEVGEVRGDWSSARPTNES